MGDFRDDVIDVTGHRPWPMPTAPWVMSQTWHDVLFAHWPVATSIVRTLVPSPLAVDEFEGLAWISVVAFGITNLGVRGLPALPGLSSMAELNVRSYVEVGGRPGVYFFSLDASNELLAHGGRWLTNLPYVPAEMEVTKAGDNTRFLSTRPDGSAGLDVTYGPDGESAEAASGSLDAFLAERYCLYHFDREHRPYRLEIHHPPWRLQPAQCSIRTNTMGASCGLSLQGAPIVRFAKRQDVVAWLPTKLD